MVFLFERLVGKMSSLSLFVGDCLFGQLGLALLTAKHLTGGRPLTATQEPEAASRISGHTTAFHLITNERYDASSCPYNLVDARRAQFSVEYTNTSWLVQPTYHSRNRCS